VARNLWAGQFAVLDDDFAGYHLVTTGDVVDQGRDNGGGLHQVLLNCMRVRIHVGVMGDAAVVEGVLDELKARDTDIVERLVIGTKRAFQAEGCYAHVAEGR